MFNLLTTSGSTTLGYSVKQIPDVSLNWIGELIRVLIDGIGIVGLGIIVFTLILKTIVLPLDIYSRVNGKKQALIMERMRPQMEKLQKQYANDKQMYQQKVMELQRKSGYSILGACLPMIVSLVIFIIVFNAFSSFSQYANLRSYNEMVKEYNGVVTSYVLEPTDDYGERVLTVDEGGNKVPLVNSDGFLIEKILNQGELDKNAEREKDEWVMAEKDYVVDYGRFVSRYNADWKTRDPEWVERATEEEVFLHLAGQYKKAHASFDGDFSLEQINPAAGQELSPTNVAVRNTLVSFYLEEPAAKRVYDYYNGEGAYDSSHTNGFLWVHNLWYPDSTLNSEMPEFAKFKSTVSKADISDDYEASYNKVTAALYEEKDTYNGYFILIILSIGMMLLQQFLSMRANKSVNELGTVDGSGKRTNKWMLIIMPLIYGIFSFFYSASFSLYMITNTTFSLVTMLIINKLVDVWFKRKEAQGKLDEILNKKAMKRAKRKAAYGGRGRK